MLYYVFIHHLFSAELVSHYLVISFTFCKASTVRLAPISNILYKVILLIRPILSGPNFGLISNMHCT